MDNSNLTFAQLLTSEFLRANDKQPKANENSIGW